MKKAIQIGAGFIYLAALLASLIIYLKPDALVFYKKSKIDVQELTVSDQAYAYQYQTNTKIFNPDTLLILEDQRILVFASKDYVKSGIGGTYTLTGMDQDQITILLSPAASGNPVTNEHTYQIYIRPYLISRDAGRFIFIILSFGFLFFIASGLLDPEKRKPLLKSPRRIVKLWIDLCESPADTNSPNSAKNGSFAPFSLVTLATINSVLAAYFYVFMEWIFEITKPSSWNVLNLGGQVQNFLIASLAVGLFVLICQAAIYILDFFLAPVFPAFRRVAFHFPTAFIFTCLSLMLLDNFTYTVFNFGVVDASTFVRLLYGFGLFALFIYFTKEFESTTRLEINKRAVKFKTTGAVLLVSSSLILAAITYNPTSTALAGNLQSTSAENLPNVIMISADGINAARMSVYGYDRDTTPFLRELAAVSLVGQSHFTNSSYSTGSETATLTGKLPITTRVLHLPDTLQGADRYQHLPGALKNVGYRTVSLGVPYYVDANTINFQNAFDSVNCAENPDVTLSSSLPGFDKEVYFLSILFGRISDRIKHIFFIKDMENPYSLVTQAYSVNMEDEERLDCLGSELEHIERNNKPLFAHIHLMGTHGPMFFPSVRVFSVGESQDQPMMDDFYDDAILDLDKHLENLVQDLKAIGQFDNTLLVLYSDHSYKNEPRRNIPLVIHFPGDQYPGSVTANTQNIDLAPTILDYLNVAQPAWMEGDSLLRDLSPERSIIAVDSIEPEFNQAGRLIVDRKNIKPPFYQFGKLTIIQCQNWNMIDLQAMNSINGELQDYPHPCSEDVLDSPEVIREKVGKMLIQRGFALPGDW